MGGRPGELVSGAWHLGGRHTDERAHGGARGHPVWGDEPERGLQSQHRNPAGESGLCGPGIGPASCASVLALVGHRWRRPWQGAGQTGNQYDLDRPDPSVHQHQRRGLVLPVGRPEGLCRAGGTGCFLLLSGIHRAVLGLVYRRHLAGHRPSTV